MSPPRRPNDGDEPRPLFARDTPTEAFHKGDLPRVCELLLIEREELKREQKLDREAHIAMSEEFAAMSQDVKALREAMLGGNLAGVVSYAETQREHTRRLTALETAQANLKNRVSNVVWTVLTTLATAIIAGGAAVSNHFSSKLPPSP